MIEQLQNRELSDNDYHMLLMLDQPAAVQTVPLRDLDDKFPAFVINQRHPLASSRPTCHICGNSLCAGESARVLLCKHAFHQSCIDPYLTQQRNTCPVDGMTVIALSIDDNQSIARSSSSTSSHTPTISSSSTTTPSSLSELTSSSSPLSSSSTTSTRRGGGTGVRQTRRQPTQASTGRSDSTLPSSLQLVVTSAQDEDEEEEEQDQHRGRNIIVSRQQQRNHQNKRTLSLDQLSRQRQAQHQLRLQEMEQRQHASLALEVNSLDFNNSDDSNVRIVNRRGQGNTTSALMRRPPKPRQQRQSTAINFDSYPGLGMRSTLASSFSSLHDVAPPKGRKSIRDPRRVKSGSSSSSRTTPQSRRDTAPSLALNSLGLFAKAPHNSSRMTTSKPSITASTFTTTTSPVTSTRDGNSSQSLPFLPIISSLGDSPNRHNTSREKNRRNSKQRPGRLVTAHPLLQPMSSQTREPSSSNNQSHLLFVGNNNQQ
eukprot:m.96654 g.96654  ORF g.96654 m.96654 type:complete len:484 (-) comp8970_c0_seq1:312-1763(-)